MSSCEICDKLWQLITKPDAGTANIDLGSFEDALTSQCPDHTQLIKAFQVHCGQVKAKRGVTRNDVGFIKSGSGDGVTLIESIEKRGLFWNLVVAKNEEDEAHPGIGRMLDPDWVDLDVVKKWKGACFSSHGAECENPLKIPPASPAFLVDVQRKCLVSGGEGRSYVALSYRSSDEALRQVATTKLQEEGTLEKLEILDQLPLKVRHAISLTEALSERYLWADFLCFDNSEPSTMAEQLDQMSSIYASALFTIIAADGKREEGIHGLKDVSQPRTLNQKVFPIGKEQLIVRNTNMFSLEHFHEYHRRGWTYQEFKMSPRKLIFMHGQVHWQCNCSAWHEELVPGSEIDKYLDPRPQVLSSGFPDLGSLENVLQNYNERELTYDEDALAAITGLLTVFSRSFPGGFLYGLPEMLIDRALAWKPQWAFTNLRKRTPTGKPPHLRFASTDLPTWSWVAWQGLFNHGYGEAVRVNDRQYWFEETTPITEWYTSSAPSGQPLRRIRSTWFEDRDRRKDASQPLPDGWTRLPAPTAGDFRNEPMLYPDGCGQFLYQHHALPDKDCDKWYYPFDVPKVDISTPYSVPEQTRYLFCKTWKTSVWSHRVQDKHGGENYHILTLRGGTHETKIGTLHLQTDEQLAMWPEPEPDWDAELGQTSSGKQIELVAINHCVRHFKTFNEELQRYGYPLGREERVTVLWVEWVDGVAYRLACGHIKKEAWETLALETVDLVLG